MLEEQASERDLMLMDEVLREARTDLAHGGAGVQHCWHRRIKSSRLLTTPFKKPAISPTMPKWCYCMEWGESFKKWTNGPGVRSLSTSL
jgi:hypothetical protein